MPRHTSRVPLSLTPYETFSNDWIGCTRCRLHEGRHHVVLARGRVPCDVLYLGEAPGESEDVLGRPFVGPAGRLLDYINERAVRVENARRAGVSGVGTEDLKAPKTRVRSPLPPADPKLLRLAYTNVVCCIPRDPGNRGKADKPMPEEIEACQPRLARFIELADPYLIVTVGGISRDALDSKVRGHLEAHRPLEWSPPYTPEGIRCVDIYHPAYILRSSVVQQGLMVQRAVVTIATALEDVFVGTGA